ncbi:MAG: nucleoside phosphorylase [Actinomycetia bacterium]|nr:nucleoside phosphorylase [Actinomycetes bacterium]
MTSTERQYHIGYGRHDLPAGTTTALLSGDPGRSELIATTSLTGARELSRNRGLDGFVAQLPSGRPVVCATSGMGAPSMSIVVNELVAVGIRTIIRVGTCGSISPDVRAGSVVIAQAALSSQGATLDIAPPQFPAAADPFLTVDLVTAARDLGVDHRLGVVASTDTFFEGQERASSSANPALLRRLQGQTDEYRSLGITAYEMEAGTLFTMGLVYRFRAACVLGVVAERTEQEQPLLDAKDRAVANAVAVAVAAADYSAG